MTGFIVQPNKAMSGKTPSAMNPVFIRTV